MKQRSSSIPWLRQRRQKSGAIYYYFEIPESKPREEIALGSDRESALIERKKLLLKFRSGNLTQEDVDIVFALNLYREIVVPILDAIPQQENLATIEKLVAFFRGSKFTFDAIHTPELQKAYGQWLNPKLQMRIRSDLSLLKRIHREFSKWDLLDTRPTGIDDSEPLCLQDITAVMR